VTYLILINYLGCLKEIKDGEYKVHIVASVLKKYLGDLPQSVIPPENYDQFIAVGGRKFFVIFSINREIFYHNRFQAFTHSPE